MRTKLETKRPEPPTERTYEEASDLLRSSQSIVLTTHRKPDGDGLGAEAALAEALQGMGKRVHVINSDSVPPEYQFLPKTAEFATYDEVEHLPLIHGADAVAILDAALPDRTGRLAGALEKRASGTLAIDHHQYAGWAQVDLVDSKASSTGEVAHRLIERLPADLTPSIAEALYTSLAFDTQVFRTANTTPEAHRLAALLLDAGADMERVHREIFGSWGIARLKLLGRFLTELRTASDGRLVWGVVSEDHLRESDLGPDAVEGFVDRALNVAGAKVAIIFTEDGDAVRISMRSRQGAEVSPLAEALGGGGHLKAAGARVSAEPAGAMRRVLEESS